MLDNWKIIICVLICLKTQAMCCECINGLQDPSIGKRQLQYESDLDIPELNFEATEIPTTLTIADITQIPPEDDMYIDENDGTVTTSAKKINNALKNSEAQFISAINKKLEELEELKNALEAFSKLTVNVTEKSEPNDSIVMCKHFQYVPELHIEKMLDVWQIVFYKAAERVSCFKIYFKRTSDGYRKAMRKKNGDFNGTVDWNKCQLELSTTASRQEKHFLQGPYKNTVFKNIIVTSDDDTAQLLDQTPDQWLVVRNLLLMRDCANGDVVVFCRVPMQCSMRDIEEALISFGENATDGTYACEALKDPRLKTLS